MKSLYGERPFYDARMQTQTCEGLVGGNGETLLGLDAPDPPAPTVALPVSAVITRPIDGIARGDDTPVVSVVWVGGLMRDGDVASSGCWVGVVAAVGAAGVGFLAAPLLVAGGYRRSTCTHVSVTSHVQSTW